MEKTKRPKSRKCRPPKPKPKLMQGSIPDTNLVVTHSNFCDTRGCIVGKTKRPKSMKCEPPKPKLMQG